MIKLLLKRSFAFMFDVSFCIIIVLFFDIINSFFNLVSHQKISWFGVIFFSFYFVFFEGILGQTLGKKFFRLTISKINSDNIQLSDAVLRFSIVFFVPFVLHFLFSLLNRVFSLQHDGLNIYINLLVISVPLSYTILCVFNGGVSIADSVSKTIVSSMRYSPEAKICTAKQLFYCLVITGVIAVITEQLFDNIINDRSERLYPKISIEILELNNYALQIEDFAVQIENSNSFLDFDWSKEYVFVETGKCGYFSKMDFSNSPYILNAELNEDACVHFVVPVQWRAFYASDYEKVIARYIKKGVDSDTRLIIVTISTKWQGMFSYLEINKKILVNPANGYIFSLEGEVEYMIGIGLDNKTSYMTEFQTYSY